MTEEISLSKLHDQLKALVASHDELAARTMALQSVVEVLAWGTWHERDELKDRLLKSGKESLAAVNEMPERMQKAVVDVWNSAYAQLANPDAGSSFIGLRPGQNGSQ